MFGRLREPLEARFEKSGIEFQRLQCVQGKPAEDQGDAGFVAYEGLFCVEARAAG